MFKYIISLFFFITCDHSKPQLEMPTSYRLDKPSSAWEMPKKLVEISGISVLNFPKILSINDEEGKLYEYNLVTKEVEEDYKFGKDGDYEDLAINGNTVYVLESNGTIIKLMTLKRTLR